MDNFEGPPNTLRFVPTNKDLVSIDNKTVEVNSVRHPEAIWSDLQERVQDQSLRKGALLPELKPKFAAAVDDLRDNIYSIIRIAGTEEPTETLLQRIIYSVNSEIREYDDALGRCNGDPLVDARSFSDVLRIAYNFASDSRKLMNLLVSLCDLKPLLLWTTVDKHYHLADSFRRLPWAKTTRKAPLAQYSDMINGARNHAFHDLIRLDRSIEVDVSGVLLKARRLRLFSPHAKRSGNALEYEDQELISVLTQFTRAPETPVSPEFWKRNSAVMHAFADLLTSTERALLLLRTEAI